MDFRPNIKSNNVAILKEELTFSYFIIKFNKAHIYRKEIFSHRISNSEHKIKYASNHQSGAILLCRALCNCLAIFKKRCLEFCAHLKLHYLFKQKHKITENKNCQKCRSYKSFLPYDSITDKINHLLI